jgi:hypothetical protein
MDVNDFPIIHSLEHILLFLTCVSGHKPKKVEKRQAQKAQSKYEKVHFLIIVHHTPPLITLTFTLQWAPTLKCILVRGLLLSLTLLDLMVTVEGMGPPQSKCRFS